MIRLYTGCVVYSDRIREYDNTARMHWCVKLECVIYVYSNYGPVKIGFSVVYHCIFSINELNLLLDSMENGDIIVEKYIIECIFMIERSGLNWFPWKLSQSMTGHQESNKNPNVLLKIYKFFRGNVRYELESKWLGKKMKGVLGDFK